MFKSKKKQIKEIKELQKQSLQKTQDRSLGFLFSKIATVISNPLYNPIIYSSCVFKQHKDAENENETGRTIFSGKRKC